MEKWIKSLESEVNNGKKLILIAGASSSGKSYNSEILAKHLSKNNRVLLISADNYYKGVAKIAVEKACQKESFDKYKKISDKLSDILKEISLNYPLQDKLTGNQIVLFKNAISQYINSDEQEGFIKEVKFQLENMNFDEPFAIDFDLLANQIKAILNKENVNLPQYSFHSSEIDKFNKIDGSEYDILIVEGLYALREELLSQLQNLPYTTSAINCDPATLLSRRLHRDILEKRSKLSQEMILMSFLDIIMPAYGEYILPTIEKAKYILNTTLTENEVKNKSTTMQVKFESDNNIHNALKSLGATKSKTMIQKDYFLVDKNKNHNHSISLRETDGVISSLTFKFNESTYSRQTESYDLQSFSLKCRQTENMLSSFNIAGFSVSDTITKTRTLYILNGKEIKIDEVEGLGIFIEMDKKDIKLYNKFKDALKLNQPINTSYRELANCQNYNNFICENDKNQLF